MIQYATLNRSEKTDSKPRPSKKAEQIVTPHLKHGSEAWKKIWWAEDYNQSLKFLYELFFEKQQAAS